MLREFFYFLVLLLTTILTGMSLPASFPPQKISLIAFFPVQTKTFLNKKKTFIIYSWEHSCLLSYTVFWEADCARQEISE